MPGTRNTNTFAEGLQKLLQDVSNLKVTPDADLQFVYELETMLLGKIREPIDQMAASQGGQQMPPAAPPMAPPMDPMMGGGDPMAALMGGGGGMPMDPNMGAGGPPPAGLRMNPGQPNPDELRRLLGQ